MKLSPSAFNRLIKPSGGLGQNLSWRRAYSCPCRNQHSGAALQGCNLCSGKGVIWDAARPAWTGLASMKITRQWADFGQWEDGDVVLTIPSDSPLYAAGEHDRMVMTDSSEPFSALLTDKAVRPPVWAPVTVKLGYAPVSILRVFWKHPDTQALTDGVLPIVTGGDSLTWSEEGGCPPAGVQFSVTGRRQQEYYIFRDLPQDRAHHGGAALPRRVVARRFDLFGR